MCYHFGVDSTCVIILEWISQCVIIFGVDITMCYHFWSGYHYNMLSLCSVHATYTHMHIVQHASTREKVHKSQG